MKKSNIRIVLIETSHPGNIGAVARAMKNMCLDQLYLVNPKDFPSATATARASGADDVLHRTVVCDSLDEALADCRVIVGASARLRSVGWPELNPRECAKLLRNEEADEAPVAIIFGREDSGLSNTELDRCQYLVHIPTNPEYQSLNIAAAVQVLCYEVFVTDQYEASVTEFESVSVQQPRIDRAPAAELEGFFEHMAQALTEIGFLKPPSCQKLIRRLRRLYHRAELDSTDINILRGILSAAEGRKYEWQKRQPELAIKEQQKEQKKDQQD